MKNGNKKLIKSNVYFYFAGHGAPSIDSRKGYLIPYDGDPNYATQTGYALDDLFKELNRIKKGVSIGDGEIGKAQVVNQKTIKARVQVRLILMQGKKREIRRIFRTLKIKLYDLKRVSFAGVSLNGLKESEYRILDEKEINHLKLKFS